MDLRKELLYSQLARTASEVVEKSRDAGVALDVSRRTPVMLVDHTRKAKWISFSEC